MDRSLGIVIPAYKPDIDILTSYVKEIHVALQPAEIRIEYDGGVQAAHKDALNRLPATINAVSHRRGKGAAVTNGFDHLNTAILLFADADGSTSVESLRAITEPIASGHASLTIGSRRHPAATVMGHQTRIRRWLGHVFALVARRLLDVKAYDYQCGAKAITDDAWRGVRPHISATGFSWDIELVALSAALGYSVSEIPITWKDQPGSTVPPISTSIELARTLVRTRHRSKVLTNDPLHTLIESSVGTNTNQVERSHGEQ